MNNTGRYLIITVVCLSLFSAALAVFGYDFEDPFVPMLPKPKVIVQAPSFTDAPIIPVEVINPPNVQVQGILLGTDVPMTIIDRGIYQSGDFIKGTDAKIHKIEQDSVVVVVKTQMFTLKTKSKSLVKEVQ